MAFSKAVCNAVVCMFLLTLIADKASGKGNLGKSRWAHRNNRCNDRTGGGKNKMKDDLTCSDGGLCKAECGACDTETASVDIELPCCDGEVCCDVTPTSCVDTEGGECVVDCSCGTPTVSAEGCCAGTVCCTYPNERTLDNFLPFGGRAGDSCMRDAGDGSTDAISIPGGIPYYGVTHHDVYIGSNGIIVFGTTWSSWQFPDPLPAIAVLYNDLDWDSIATIWYRTIEDQSILSELSTEIQCLFGDASFTASTAIVATFDNIPLRLSTNYNTFQAVLVTDGTSTFVMLVYDTMEYGGSAIGFNAPGQLYVGLPTTSPTLVTMSNVDVPGKFWYRIDTTIVEPNQEEY